MVADVVGELVEGVLEVLAGDGDQVEAVAVGLDRVQGGVVEGSSRHVRQERIRIGQREIRAPAACRVELPVGDDVGQRGLAVLVHLARDRLGCLADHLARGRRRGCPRLTDELLGGGIRLDVQIDRLVEHRGLRTDDVASCGIHGEVDDGDRAAVGSGGDDHPLVVVRVEDAARGRAARRADDQGVDRRVDVLDHVDLGELLRTGPGVQVVVHGIGLNQADDRLDSQELQRLHRVIERAHGVGQPGGGLRSPLRRHGHRHDAHAHVTDPVDGEGKRRRRVVRRDHVGGQERKSRPAEGRQRRVDPALLLGPATGLDQGTDVVGALV